MKIVVDENIPMAEECFGSLGEVVRVPGRQLKANQLIGADALIVRSITQVNEGLLSGTSIKFVGTATIGVDHIDKVYLSNNKIGFSSAPGCNAISVVEYVIAALLELESIRDFSLDGKTIGIIGVGNVGSRLKMACEKLGLSVLLCDPPKQEQGMAGLVSADEAWKADIVTLHVPYDAYGKFPTRHLADRKRLQNMVDGGVLINTSRGSVVDNSALSQILDHRHDLSVILDVWEGEPSVNLKLAGKVDLATPHIAGYSYDGKVRGTWMIYQALCDFLKKSVMIQEYELIDEKLNIVLDFSSSQIDTPRSARDVLRCVYDICEDDVGLRATLQLPRPESALRFDSLRKSYRVRREFHTATLLNEHGLRSVIGENQLSRLQALGFQMN